MGKPLNKEKYSSNLTVLKIIDRTPSIIALKTTQHVHTQQRRDAYEGEQCCL